MKKIHWLILFSLVLAAELMAIQLVNENVQYICKPLLMIILVAYFLSRTNKIVSGLKKWIVLALAFSWIGDVLLMFQEYKSIFFLLGLSAFLLAHIFYILFFHSIRIKEKIKGKAWLLVIVVIYYAALIWLLSPYLEDMTYPVRVYGIVISFMFMLAMHMLFIKNKKAGQSMMVGASLFLVSDSVLAINMFYEPIEMAGVIVMLTYGVGQYLITEGASKYIQDDLYY